MRGMTWDHPRGYAPLRAFGGGVDWDAQPLEDFEARPVRELAERYDLVVLDHPGLGAAIAGGALLPLEEVFEAGELAGWQAASIGPTWASYTLDGHQWALPIDAATQVTAYRPDRLDKPPADWADVAQTVRTVPSALCLSGPHAMLSYIALGEDEEALRLLRELWPHVDRAISLSNPIAVHEAMARGEIAYCPLVYGYAAYPGLAWADAPGRDGGEPLSVLGGTGLAVTTHAAGRLDEVRAWARAFLDPAVQTGLVPEHDGQPAHSAVWNGDGAYYAATVRSLVHAKIRPRHDGWIAIQDAGSEIVRECVTGALSPATARAEIQRRMS